MKKTDKLTQAERHINYRRLIDKGFEFPHVVYVGGRPTEVFGNAYQEREEVGRMFTTYFGNDFDTILNWSEYHEITSNRNSRAMAEKIKGMKGRDFLSRRFKEEIVQYEKLTAGLNLTGDRLEGEEKADIIKEVGDLEAFIQSKSSPTPQKLVNTKEEAQETGEDSPVYDEVKPEDIYPFNAFNVIGDGIEAFETREVIEEIINNAGLTDNQVYYFRQVVSYNSVSFAEIAKDLGTSRQSVQNWLHPSTIKKVALYIHKIGVEDLFGIDETPEIRRKLEEAIK